MRRVSLFESTEPDWDVSSTHLVAAEWFVDSVPLDVCLNFVSAYHYSGGGSNTATFRHGLYRQNGSIWGIAWWMPPTKSAALATYPEWQSVLSLHRLAIHPAVPTNGASFLIGRSIRLIRRDKRWKCLVTYADEGQGHTGAIYRATNWDYIGTTTAEAQWADTNGRHISRKAGPKTRTKADMEALGFTMIGRNRKHKFVKVL